MKFRISSDVLHAHFQLVSKVIIQKNPIPLLECVLFEFKDKELTLTASDSETRLITRLEVDEKEGEDMTFAVRKWLLLDSLKEISDQPITLDVDPETLNVKLEYQSGHYTFRAEDASAYPGIKEHEGEEPVVIEMPQSIYLKGLDYTVFATSVEDTRPITTGVYFDFKEDKVIFVGTDGFLLSMYENTNYHSGKTFGFTFPKKPAQILSSTLDKDDEEAKIKITVYDNFADISTENFRLLCPLIVGKYPNYSAVIPRNNENKIIADRQQLYYALRRVSPFSNQAINLVNLVISPSELELKASDMDFSTTAEEKVPISYEGNPQSISFRAPHLMSVLSNLKSENVVFKLGDKASPGLISPVEIEEGEMVTALVMPLMR